jgi:hypothetical protein
MRERDVQFIQDLAAAFPVLRPMLAEHLDDNFGAVLPHLFLADVLRLLLARIDEAGVDDRGEVANILSFLEDAFSAGDAERQELISTGFVENLPRVGEPGDGIRRMLGPELRDEAGRVA